MFRRVILDDTDLEILESLKINAREGVREIARKINKPPSTISSKIKRLESLGIIKRYVALVDHSKLGYRINALTLLQVDGAHIEEIEKKLAEEKCVRAVYDITGEYDIAIITAFRDVSELDRFIKRILQNPYIKRSVTNIILRIAKETPNVEEDFRELLKSREE
ncbi:MAG: Lrp/AsnC family transcriptional regulator [Sulfolobales archaeon]